MVSRRVDKAYNIARTYATTQQFVRPLRILNKTVGICIFFSICKHYSDFSTDNICKHLLTMHSAAVKVGNTAAATQSTIYKVGTSFFMYG